MASVAAMEVTILYVQCQSIMASAWWLAAVNSDDRVDDIRCARTYAPLRARALTTLEQRNSRSLLRTRYRLTPPRSFRDIKLLAHLNTLAGLW